jgi:hypothetical protein
MPLDQQPTPSRPADCASEDATLPPSPTSLEGLNPPEPASSPEGPRIPGCKILAPLGRGGMGVVYKAEQVSL